MDSTHDPRPDRAPQRPVQPVRRPFVSDFAPRPVLRPAPPTQQPTGPASVNPAVSPGTTPQQTRPATPQANILDLRPQQPIGPPQASAARPVFGQPLAVTNSPATSPVTEQVPTTPSTNQPQEPKEKSKSGHAGLLGLGIFVVLAALLLSPLLPGKVLDNFPGSSASFSSGSNLPCIEPPKNVTITKQFTTKFGAPIVYQYTSSSEQHAMCDGASATADAGTSGQFNPLGLVLDTTLALVVALGTGIVWGALHRRKHNKPNRTR